MELEEQVHKVQQDKKVHKELLVKKDKKEKLVHKVLKVTLEVLHLIIRLIQVLELQIQVQVK